MFGAMYTDSKALRRGRVAFLHGMYSIGFWLPLEGLILRFPGPGV